jgi:putative glutamine amidotransferase
MPQPPRVAVLHIRTSRPHAPGFQAELDMLNDAALEALAAEGWDAELVAVTERPADEVRRLARAADVVLVMGGEDVDPAFYGGLSEYPGSGVHEPDADRIAFEIMREAIAEHRPLLAICRGLQQLNVALGGTLHEHMTGHVVKADDSFVSITVHAEADTEIARLGASAPVRCSHHQAIRDVAPGLRVTARASDGTVEAVEHVGAPVAAVQWHPEHPAVARDQLAPLVRAVLERRS